ncbi:hypothetical protein VCHA53O466_50343 [Vibrio chagasii]|nr:hypothetical protein VCHA53O466_50343 [Vibrio chagasii]
MPLNVPFSPMQNSHLIVSGDLTKSKQFFDAFLEHYDDFPQTLFKDVLVDDLGSDYLNIVLSEPESGLEGVRYIDGWSRVGVSTVSLIPAISVPELKVNLENLGLSIERVEGGLGNIVFVDGRGDIDNFSFSELVQS